MRILALLLLLCVPSFSQTLVASFYAEKFNGRRTASGQTYDSSKFTAASRIFKFGTCLRLFDRKTRKSTNVLINDYGPAYPRRDLDISRAAADQLGLKGVKTYEAKVLPRNMCFVH